MIDLKTAIAVLDKYGTYTSHSYRWLLHARKYVQEHNVHVDSQWLNYCADIYWEEKPNIFKESTYEDCVMAEFSANDDKIQLKIVVFDGDSYNGRRLSRRCEFILLLDFVDNEINDIIDSAIKRQAIVEIEEEDAEQLRQRKIKKYNQIISRLQVK